MAGQRASPEAARSAWETANAAYRAGDFERAAAVFGELAARHRDPHLEADLAAALWRAGRPGEAVLHYRRALALAPRETVIRSDLERLRTGLALPDERAWTDVLERVRLDELLRVFLGASALGFVAFAAGRGGRKVAVPVLLAIALVGAVTAARALREGLDLAVAVRPTVIASAPGGAGIEPLPEGSTVQVLERDPRGWRVRPPGGPAGWAPALDLEPIDAPARPRGAR
jgi:tetratricopeptide (TPR) repeat protein